MQHECGGFESHLTLPRAGSVANEDKSAALDGPHPPVRVVTTAATSTPGFILTDRALRVPMAPATNGLHGQQRGRSQKVRLAWAAGRSRRSRSADRRVGTRFPSS